MHFACAAFGCNNRRSIQSRSRGITFHKFPKLLGFNRKYSSFLPGTARIKLQESRGQKFMTVIRIIQRTSTSVTRSIFQVPDMAPGVDDIIRLCCEISAHKKIKVAFKHPIKGVMVAGSSMILGGLVGGPVGMAVGGAVGGLLGRWTSRGQFQPLPQILMELSPSQKQKLCDEIRRVLGSSYCWNWISTDYLIFRVMRDAELKQKVASALINHVTKELRVKVRYKD
ncbi:hypothetical protein OJAV_G00026850 [Oryzias javanicus]|uniref:Uncharacterized protein n=1 Tax=Oryzias javanicus TaxID=123683 RepID=A0A437DIP4_ORYJA|nr:hypothetical protein OJAV_G00026850 [Oryzias javanicus]